MLCKFNLDDLSQVESLIGRAADVKKLVNTKDDDGRTLLHIVADSAETGRFLSHFYK